MTVRSPSFAAATRNFYLGLSMLVCAVAFGLHSSGALAADPSLHQVYEAASGGDYKAAQGMMDQVLRDHPNSAKAHFVEAELLVKQGQTAQSASELKMAEALDPTLSFAKPGAVQELKGLLTTAAAHPAQYAARAVPAQAGLPWGMIMAGLALLAAIIFFLRSRRQAQTYIPAGAGGLGAGNYGPAPYGGQPPYGPVNGPMSGSGMGSGILGGLATGAAVGAGMIAGEALMHRVLDGGSHAASGSAFANDLGPADNTFSDAERRYDMGGNDFGVNDTSSWDDSGGGSNDDWS